MSNFRQVFKLVFALTLLSATPGRAQEEITFDSSDGLKLTADFYGDPTDKSRPLICLFHQAGWSRGEYREIAPKLVAMGFHCLAVDARSGGEVNGVVNETVQRNQKRGEKVGYDFIKAYPDVVATLKYARENLAEGKLIAWGSSYSSTLILKASIDNEGLVDGTLSFAPNAKADWAQPWLLPGLAKIKHPVFITSAKDEKPNWQPIYENLPPELRSSYLPKTKGNHGSRALWEEFADHTGYWTAVTQFLETRFLQPAGSVSE